MSSAPSIYALGTVFGPYRIERLLGVGGMGSVYAATHVELDKRVVVKILHPEFASNSVLRGRFMQEGRAASRVRHEHVVDVTDMGVANNIPYLVMEHLEGETLLNLVKRTGPLTIELAADVLLPVVAAVSAMHRRGVIHRDLKPDNIFLTRHADGRLLPKVLDFGIARILAGTNVRALTLADDVLGTPAYMSPEQLRSTSRVDVRTDQYALGLLLYECVTGCCPFKDKQVPKTANRVMTGDFPRPSELRPDLPPAIEETILRAMQRDREKRFASVEEIGQAIIAFASAPVRRRWGATFPTAAVTDAPPEEEAAIDAGEADVLESEATTRAYEPLTFEESARVLEHAAPDQTTQFWHQPRARGSLAVGASLFALAFALTVWQVAAPLATSAVASTTALYSLAPVHAPRVTAAPPEPARALSLRVEPAKAQVELDGVPLGRAPVVLDLPRDRRRHHLRVTADGYVPYDEVFETTPSSDHVSLQPVPVVVASAARSKPTLEERPRPRPTIRWRYVPHPATPQHPREIEVPY